MMNLIQKFFKKDKTDRSLIRKNFTEYFFSLPEHQWFNHSSCRIHFENLIQRLPVGLIEALMTQYPVVFMESSDFNKQSPGMVSSSTIVVFPEFQKLLRSSSSAAEAYLAHELAFVIYELGDHQQDPLMAEIEADKFVCDIGLENELETLLLMLDETIEKRLRLTYLTINHFTGGQNS